LPEYALVRFVCGPDDAIAPDVAAKLPGRGVWVRADRASLETAIRRNAFARSLKRPAQASTSLVRLTEDRLAARCLDLVGLGARAGALALGFDQVEAAIRGHRAFGLIEASDGAEDGRAKLARLYFGLIGTEPFTVGCFTAAELGMALGRDRVVHAGWLQERMARRWAAEIGRLAGFRAITPASWRTSAETGR